MPQKSALERLREMKAAEASAEVAAREAAAPLGAEMARLLEYSIRLRCGDPPKGTRAQALTYQAQQIEKLSALSVSAGGTRNGWPDPGDPFAYGDQVALLRADLADLEAGPYPVPLPAGCVLLPQANFDPFEYGRTFSGRVAGPPAGLLSPIGDS